MLLVVTTEQRLNRRYQCVLIGYVSQTWAEAFCTIQLVRNYDKKQRTGWHGIYNFGYTRAEYSWIASLGSLKYNSMINGCNRSYRLDLVEHTSIVSYLQDLDRLILERRYGPVSAGEDAAATAPKNSMKWRRIRTENLSGLGFHFTLFGDDASRFGALKQNQIVMKRNCVKAKNTDEMTIFQEHADQRN